MSKQVDLGPFTPVGQVLGRCHRLVLHKGVKALALETEDFARQCVDLYEVLSSKAVKQYQTPHVDPGSFVVSDDAPRGELSASAARMVMKLLSRPDILVAVNASCSESDHMVHQRRRHGGEISSVRVLLCPLLFHLVYR